MKDTMLNVQKLLSRKGMDLSVDGLESLDSLDLYKRDVDDDDLKVLSALEGLEFLSLAVHGLVPTEQRWSDSGFRARVHRAAPRHFCAT